MNAMNFILTQEQVIEIENRFNWRIPFRITDLDVRVTDAAKIIHFIDKSVLDVGTLDGHIASSLIAVGANVTTIDCRMSNLALGWARIFSLGYDANKVKFILGDIENLENGSRWDIIFHSGVFYHLNNPVKHLLDLYPYFNEYLVLETHTANLKTKRPGKIELHDQEFNGTWSGEGGFADAASAKDCRESFWLDHESIEKLFRLCCLKIKATIYKDKYCEAGPRSCWILEK